MEAENLSTMSSQYHSPYLIQVSYTIPQEVTRHTHLVVNKRCQGKEIEEVGEEPPDVSIAVFAQAFVVEPIHLGDLTRFVIAAQDGDAITVPQLEGHEERDGFDRVVPSINIIAHEEVVCIWRVAADAE